MTHLAARFMTRLQVRRAQDSGGGEWELTAPLIYLSAILPHVIIVPEGFKTNFASVPRLPLAFWLFGSVADEPAVVHDWLYTSNVAGVTRKEADAVFAEACKVYGVSAWKRGPMWLGVRLFGGSHWGTGTPLAPQDAGELADVQD